MDVSAADLEFGHVLGELFGHPFGEGGDEDTFIALDNFFDFFEEIIYLIGDRSYFDGWVEEAGGADDLLYDDAFAVFEFVFGGCGANEDDLFEYLFEFFKFQGTIVHCSRQAEPVIHEVNFS